MLSPVQFDGRSRRHLHNRPRATPGPRPHGRLPNGIRLFRAVDAWHPESRGALVSPAKKSLAKKILPRAAAKPAPDKRIELLFEVGCEEIPAGMLARAEAELKAGLEKQLTAENLMEGVAVESFSTPRRLTLWARGLPVRQADVTSEVTGPPKSVAYDAVGAPTRAAVSFAEKQGIALHEVYFLQTPKGEYLAAKQVKRGRATEHILADILPRILHDLYWPKTMTWTGLSGARFIRPIRWLVGLFDGQALKFSYGDIAASNVTRGHRFIGSSTIKVHAFADYEKQLRSNGVVVRPAERLEKIRRELAGHAKKGNYRVHEDADLLKLVTYLT